MPHFTTYPDFDGRSSSSTEPVAVGGEAERVDDVTTIQSVQVLALIQVPQHGLAVLATRSTQGAIW